MKTSSPSRRPQVTVVLEAPLKSALTEMAQRDGRSLSNLIRKLAEEHVRAEQCANAA
jgi:predicted DNA-binding ribbon-helix-helix protein